MDACKQFFWRTHLPKMLLTSLFSIACTDSKFDFGSVQSTMHRAVCDISHSRNHPSFAAVIASPPPSFYPGYFSIESAILRRLLSVFSSPASPANATLFQPCCCLTFLPPPFSLAIPFLRCWTITLSRKAVAAITSAPKLLRHLGASLVLLRRNGNQRGGHERRKTGEVKEKRRRKRDGEEREAGVGLGEVMYWDPIVSTESPKIAKRRPLPRPPPSSQQLPSSRTRLHNTSL